MRPLPNKQNPASMRLAKLVLAHQKTGYSLAIHDALMRQPIELLNVQSLDTVLNRIDPENTLPAVNLEADYLYVDLFWNRSLAHMAGIERAPGMILGPEIIDHDAYSVFNLSQMVGNL